MHYFRIGIKIYKLIGFYRLYIIYSIAQHILYILYIHMYHIFVGMAKCSQAGLSQSVTTWRGVAGAAKMKQMLKQIHSELGTEGTANLNTYNQYQ